MAAMILTIPAMATTTVSGPDAGLFGRPTSVDEEIIIGGHPTEAGNINRSKNSAVVPPPFGSPASNTLGTGELLTPGISGIRIVPVNPTTSSGAAFAQSDPGGTQFPPPAEQPSLGIIHSGRFTSPDGMYYPDGSLGTLSIPNLAVTAKIFHDENLENLARGVGHFSFTSGWDGNVGLAAHNRGIADFFGQIHTLSAGDRIVYTTTLGTRNYEVFFVGQIRETDFSRLGRLDENVVTLITCVRNAPEMRWCVQAREIN